MSYWSSSLRALLITFLVMGLQKGYAQTQHEIKNLSGTAGETNVALNWNIYSPAGDSVIGYNIYRRKEGESYGDPIAFTGLQDRGNGTQYTDTRLEPGRRYYYKIKGRNLQLNETGSSQEISVTTNARTGTYYTYANMKVAVVVYRNANHRDGGTYVTPDPVMQDIKFFLEKAREFYWRNTNMKLNLEFSYFDIEEYKNFGDVSKWGSMEITGNHLQDDFGVVNTQYDIVFRIDPAIGGFHSFMATTGLKMTGPERRTGFSQLQWPLRERSDLKYPFEFEGKVSKNIEQLIWLFIHETQHAVDGIYRHNNHPEMGHGDHPEKYDDDKYPQVPDSVRFGKRYDFQAALLRTFDPGSFEAFEDLNPDWGDIYEAVDSDRDRFPDHDPRVPINEATFGTSSFSADMDGDGYTDKQECTDGIYHYSYSDPRDPDTDDDGVIDGMDTDPRYPINRSIKSSGNKSFIIDGNLSEWSTTSLISEGLSFVTGDSAFSPRVFASYDDRNLYLGIELPEYSEPVFYFDFDADGRWFGKGNTEMHIDLLSEKLEFRSKAGRLFDDRKVPVGFYRNGSKYQIEMAIPRNEQAALTLKPGEEMGLRMEYKNVFHEGIFGTTFDRWSYEYFHLENKKLVQLPESEQKRATLSQNYPNPFRSRTTIEYSVPQKGPVEIAVYDILGRRIQTLLQTDGQPGNKNQLFWDGTTESGNPVPSGIYFYRMTTPSGNKITHKMVLIR